MKRISFSIVFIFFAGFSLAENMSFVTTLSHPVGTFATVESLNDKSPVQSLQVNFCNTKVGTGNIDLGGAMRAAYLKTLPNTQLGGSVPAYQLKTLYVGNNNTLTGGNIVANTANPGKAKVSQTLYAPDMTYLVAELPALKIKNGSNVNANIKSGGAGAALQWGNQYPCAYQEQYVPVEGSDDEGNVVGPWAAAPWRGASSGQDTCLEGLPYSPQYFTEYVYEASDNIHMFPCTDWKFTRGYNGQSSGNSGNNPVMGGTYAACPTDSDYVSKNWASDNYGVYWEKFIGKFLFEYITSDYGFNCNMGGEANTYVACKLPNGNVAYECYWAKKRTIDRNLEKKTTCVGKEDAYDSYLLKSK